MNGIHEGIIDISDQVISKIARKVVLETGSIVSMPKNIVGNIVKRLSGNHPQNGIRVNTNQQERLKIGALLFY